MHWVILFILFFWVQGCAVRDHQRTQDLFNEAVSMRQTDPAQALSLFQRVKDRTKETYPLPPKGNKTPQELKKEKAGEPLIDLSGVGAFFGIVTTPEPDLKANALFMLAESSLQLGDYDTAKRAAWAGLNEGKKKGSVDTVMMNMVIPRVIIREEIEKLGETPLAFWGEPERGSRIQIKETYFIDKISKNFAIAYNEIKTFDATLSPTEYSLDVQFIPEREMIRILRQWEIMSLYIDLESPSSNANERRKAFLTINRNALKSIAITASEKSLQPFADVYCPIRNRLNPNFGPGVSWLRRDVDEAILAGSSKAGINPCDKWVAP